MTRKVFYWVLKFSLSLVWNTLFATLLGDIWLPKIFYNSALLSRHFLSLCLGWEFSLTFLVSSEFLSGICLCCWLVAQLSPTHCHPMICKPTSLLWLWGFPRQECWSRLPCSPTKDVSDPKMEFVSGLLCLLYCSQILYSRAKIYLGYMTHYKFEDS